MLTIFDRYCLWPVPGGAGGVAGAGRRSEAGGGAQAEGGGQAGGGASCRPTFALLPLLAPGSQIGGSPWLERFRGLVESRFVTATDKATDKLAACGLRRRGSAALTSPRQ